MSYDNSYLIRLSLVDLKSMAKRKGLSSTGNRGILIKRLGDYERQKPIMVNKCVLKRTESEIARNIKDMETIITNIENMLENYESALDKVEQSKIAMVISQLTEVNKQEYLDFARDNPHGDIVSKLQELIENSKTERESALNKFRPHYAIGNVLSLPMRGIERIIDFVNDKFVGTSSDRSVSTEPQYNLQCELIQITSVFIATFPLVAIGCLLLLLNTSDPAYSGDFGCRINRKPINILELVITPKTCYNFDYKYYNV